MAYLHCHNCNWSQDDFWSETYNPGTCAKDDEQALLNSNLDDYFTDCTSFIEKHGKITRREEIARHFERLAKLIRTMKFRTFEEFKFAKENGLALCPQCGKRVEFDID